MEPMTQACPRCGAPDVGSGPSGLCRVCLIRGVLGEEPESELAETGPEAVPETIRVLGGYELREEIARGGMGVVYRGWQVALQREVAVKVLLGGAFAGRLAEGRFRNEMLAAARMQHPGIVPVHDVGHQAGQWYLVMEWVQGEDLGTRVQRGRLDPIEAARCGEEVARAVQHAHERGVLHRDLKPSNILIDLEGRCRVTDFGLAKLLDEGGEGTLSGQILGSPGFLPPEQAGVSDREGASGPASDVYGLGATLYHALTGRPPFQGDGLAATLELVRTTDPLPPRLLNGSIPRDLETILLRCLQREPGRRYRSMVELAEDLGRFRRGQPVVARPVAGWERAWMWCRRKPMAAAVVVLGAILAVFGPVAAWQFNRLRMRAEVLAEESRGRLAAARSLAATSLMEEGAGLEGLPFLVDALRICERDPVAAGEARLQLGILGPRLPVLERFWKVGPDLRDAWLQDGGRTLVTWHRPPADGSSPSLWGWSTVTGEPAEIQRPPGRAGLAIAVSEGHEALAMAEGKGVRVRWRGTNGVESAYLELAGVPTAAAFSRDGRLVAAGTGEGELKVVRLDPGLPRAGAWQFTNEVRQLRFGRDNSLVMVRLDEAFLRVADLGTGRLTRNVGRFHPITDAALAPDGEDVLLASADGHMDVWSLFRSTRRFEVTGAPGIVSVAWSPNSGVVATGERTGRVRVWTVQGRRLVSHALSHGAPVWKILFIPDGRRIVTLDGMGVARVWRLPVTWRAVEAEGRDEDLGTMVRATSLSTNRPSEASGAIDGVGWVATADESGRVRIRTTRGRLLWSSPVYRAPVQALRLEGETLRVELAGGGRDEVRLGMEMRPLGVLESWSRLVSGRRVAADGSLRVLTWEEIHQASGAER